MKKFLGILVLLILLLISCNTDPLINNGEITRPDGEAGKTDSGESVVFSKKAPEGVNATKSYYEDSISIIWNAVNGADYYTLEKAVRDDREPATDDDTWSTIGETITTTSYRDYSSLEIGKYYSYKVTAHTFQGERGETSAVSVGTILASPETLSASKGTSETAILLSWNQMPYVESYEIYKSEISSITGSKSELVDSVNANENEEVNYYSYEIDQAKEKGKELYFAVVGVSPTGEKAALSQVRSGYTLVPGAPGKPEVSAEKGEDNTVTLHFKSGGDDSEYKFVIKRSYAGSAEQVVFSTEFDSLTQDEDSGTYVFEDTDVKENIEYSYSVTAENNIGISQAGTDYGYAVSTVKNLALVANKEKYGYDITYSLPLGMDDENRTAKYTFVVTKTLKNGTVLEAEEYYEDELSSFNTFIPVERTLADDSKEVQFVEIYVENSAGVASGKAVSNSLVKLQAPVTAISATSFNKPLNGEKANSSGVYPVHIKWTTTATDSMTLVRKGSDGSVKSFKVTGSSYDDTTTSPLVIYDYYIDTSDGLGRTLGEIKHATNSYAAVTPETFINMFESALKPWDRQTYVPSAYRDYWKKSKIATLVGYGNASDLSTQLKALDSAEDKDHYRSDSKITYSASTEGVGGQIYFTYNRFGESSNFYMTGSYEMHVNASGTGSAKSSTNGFTTGGMYSGQISLEKISVANKAFTGSYVFTINYSDGAVGGYEVAAK